MGFPTTMPSHSSAGARFRAALRTERPLQVAGTINAYSALLAERAGFRAIYLSGAGVANASHGIPDVGLTSLADVCEDIRRITRVTDLPLLVDADTAWDNAARTVREMIRAGAAGCHIEDQVSAKRCGHLPGKRLVGASVMCGRISAAARGRTDPKFVIMARTDAHATEGMDRAVARAKAYVAAGADMIFAEALTTLAEYRAFAGAMGRVPVLANITEFGKTPLFTRSELRSAGVAMALYPLGAFRAMSRAAEGVYEAVRRHGTQKSVVGAMQTRAQLYEVLGYDAFVGELARRKGARR
jgi:methylisocitrate lyase